MLPVRALYVPASDRSESVISQCCCVLSDDLSDANKVPVHLDVSNHARLVHVDKANISSSFLFLRFICLKVRVTEEEKVDRKRGRGEGKRERERPFIYWFAPQIATVAMAGPSRCQGTLGSI